MSVLRNLKCLSNSVSCLSSYNRNISKPKQLIVCNYCKESGVKQENKLQFFNDEVQKLLQKLTKIDVNKVFRQRKLGQEQLSTPEFKFMTDQELEQARKDANIRAQSKLQMPPVLPPRKEINHVYINDNRLQGFSNSKYIFTDISFGKNDRTRHIVVRDLDGTLRKATWEERERSNEIYFPRKGRKLRVPKMFQPGFFEDVLSKEWFEFILDRACIQFEPDDPLYIQVVQTTYDKVSETGKFKDLESTRHYGPLVYHLIEKNNLASLLTHYLNSDRLDDILDVIKIYEIIHPNKWSSASYSPGQEFSMVKAFITELFPDKADLLLTLKSYEDYLSQPKSQAVA